MSSVTSNGGVDDARVRSLLIDSLALWRVDGAVVSADARASALIIAADGTHVWIERGDSAFRWFVRSRKPGDTADPREARPRPCSSIVGMLNAVRSALGVNTGEAVRIASWASGE